MKKPDITEEKVKTLYETKFLSLYDLQYAEGRHYFDVTRKKKTDLMAIKSDEEFKQMLPDAVSCFVILKVKDEEPKLLLMYEFRYPAGRFLLSPPAGLIDKEDAENVDHNTALITAAKREIFEETGVVVKDTDQAQVLSPLAFSTPGMTDEANGLVGIVAEVDDLSMLTQSGAVGSECFNGFKLLDREEARQTLKTGRDEFGNYFSVYTWAAMMYFISDLWQ